MVVTFYGKGRQIMLTRSLVRRLDTLTSDLDTLYEITGDGANSTQARLVAAGTLTCFLSSSDQPIENWLLDLLVMRLGLCTVYAIMGTRDVELESEVALINRELSPRAVRRLERIIERLASREFAGGGMASVVSDRGILDRLYQQCLNKAATIPVELLRTGMADLSVLESLLA
jgi:hypothetical protein